MIIQRSRNSMISNVLAFLAANMVAYIYQYSLGIRGWERHHFIIEILLFYAVSGIAAFIGTGLMGVLIRRFGILTTYAFASNIFTAVMINYAVEKIFYLQRLIGRFYRASVDAQKNSIQGDEHYARL